MCGGARHLNETATSLKKLWLDGIPLAAAMQIDVVEASEQSVVVAMPVDPNRNHMDSVFGGSLLSLATLAGWGLVQMLLDEPQEFDIVIAEISMKFEKPVYSRTIAHCDAPDEHTTERFQKNIEKRGRARLRLAVEVFGEVFGNNEIVARCDCSYAAVRKK